MPEENVKQDKRVRKIRHKGRVSQIPIYLGKQIRFFVNQNDWKVLPMAAVIAGLVAMVIRNNYFVDMEGSLFGSFALTCVAIWNGCFNSIQAVCRERSIIKREHRSGMHISSYVAAHMIYQLFLCAAQTGISLYVLRMAGVKFPEEGFMTSYMILDIGITMLLISYASDMLSLLVSSIAHTTTGAMTVMPFVLIFQLVFSGGLLPLPAWSENLSYLTVSNYGFQALNAQSGYNELPMNTGWEVLERMKDEEISLSITVGEALDFLSQPDNPVINSRRDNVIIPAMSVSDAAEVLNSAADSLQLREKEVLSPMTVREALTALTESEDESIRKLREVVMIPAIGGSSGVTMGDFLNGILEDESVQGTLENGIGTVKIGDILDALHTQELMDQFGGVQMTGDITLGQIIDTLAGNRTLQGKRGETITLETSVGEIMDLVGEEEMKQLVMERTAAASRNPKYERDRKLIINHWITLFLFIVGYAFLATLTLEFIDKDKR